MTDKIIHKIKSLNLWYDYDKSELDDLFEFKTIKKNEKLLSLNSVCKHYYFINKGALKVIYLNNGEEITSFFAFENYYFTELQSYSLRKPTLYEIVAIEDCEILQIAEKNMNYLLNKYPNWQLFLNKTQEETIIKLTYILQQFQTKSATDRYQELFNHPDFVQRTKQKDLSTMIGITKHSLSRIRKKK